MARKATKKAAWHIPSQGSQKAPKSKKAAPKKKPFGWLAKEELRASIARRRQEPARKTKEQRLKEGRAQNKIWDAERKEKAAPKKAAPKKAAKKSYTKTSAAKQVAASIKSSREARRKMEAKAEYSDTNWKRSLAKKKKGGK